MYKLGVNRVQAKIKIKIVVPVIFSDYSGGKFSSSIISYYVFGDVCQLVQDDQFDLFNKKSI